MKKLHYSISLWACFALFFACHGIEEAEISSQQAILSTHTLEELSGKQVQNGAEISYSVNLEENESYSFQIQLNNKSFEGQISYLSQEITIDGHEEILSGEELLALHKSAIAIGEHILEARELKDTEIEVSQAENTLVQVMNYISNAPKNYVYGQLDFKPDVSKGYGNEGIRCIKRGRNYTLYYDGSRGRTSSRKRAGYNGGGSYGCMGRCGANCGRWWIPSAWTLDCFEHDECSLRYRASGGSSDRNCGDEYNEAADDYVFGVIRGCNGR
ncbi:MAG: hypothetical protein AAF696_13285 [Bacteroidota bacterium]